MKRAGLGICNWLMGYLYLRKLNLWRKSLCQEIKWMTRCSGHGHRVELIHVNRATGFWRWRTKRTGWRKYRMVRRRFGKVFGVWEFLTKWRTFYGVLVERPFPQKPTWSGDTLRKMIGVKGAGTRRKQCFMRCGLVASSTRYGYKQSGVLDKHQVWLVSKSCYLGCSRITEIGSSSRWSHREFGTSETKFKTIKLAAHRISSCCRQKRN